jgi:glycosyltransferase involved in cell wall biosynthesis
MGVVGCFMSFPSAAGASGRFPLVSVVIPAYNHGRYLAEAIESVLAQDYPARQVIVIDDGSTDETADVLQQYSRRVEAISQANAGQSATINRGWHTARGQILSYLSADDRLASGALTTAVRALESDPALVMVYGDYDLIDSSSARVRRVIAPEFDYNAMITRLVCAPGPGVFLRRSAVERTGGWNSEFRQAPDLDYWLRLGLHGPFRRVPAVLAGFRVHPGSTSYAVTTEKRAAETVQMIEAFFNRPDLPAHIRTWQAQALSSAHIVTGRFHLHACRYSAAARHLRRALALYPRNFLSPVNSRMIVGSGVRPAVRVASGFVRRLRERHNLSHVSLD